MSWTQRILVYLFGVLMGLALLGLWRSGKDGTGGIREAVEEAAVAGFYPFRWEDAYGRTVVVPQEPERVISLAPSITETIFALAAQEKLVGRTRWCQWPEEAAAIPSLGSMDQPNLELLLAADADLVLVSDFTPRAVVHRIAEAGLTVVTFDYETLEQVMNSFRLISRIVGAPFAGDQLANQTKASLSRISERLEAAGVTEGPRVALFYNLDEMTSAGPDTWPGELLQHLKAENVAANAPSDWPRLSKEGLLASRPDVILWLIEEDQREATQERIQELGTDPFWSMIPAVREGRIYVLDEGPWQIPGPRLTEAVEEAAHALYPDVFTE